METFDLKPRPAVLRGGVRKVIHREHERPRTVVRIAVVGPVVVEVPLTVVEVPDRRVVEPPVPVRRCVTSIHLGHCPPSLKGRAEFHTGAVVITSLHKMKVRSVTFLPARCKPLPATLIPGTLALEIVDFGDGRP